MGNSMKKNVGLTFYQPEKKKHTGVVIEIFVCMILMMIAAFIAIVCVYFFGFTSKIVGTSMEPGLRNGQTILVNRFAYVLFMPEKGDVVVFLPHGNEKTHYYVKRIVACPGDTVQVIDGKLFVNDEPSDIMETEITEPGIASKQIILENGQYFCIGDNPIDGEDSRQANIGPVDKNDIIGKAWFYLKYEEESSGFIR